MKEHVRGSSLFHQPGDFFIRVSGSDDQIAPYASQALPEVVHGVISEGCVERTLRGQLLMSH